MPKCQGKRILTLAQNKMSQSLLIEKKESQETEEIKKEVCSVCGSEDLYWSIGQRDKCFPCLEKDYQKKFHENGLNQFGFSVRLDGGFKFYSETTGIEEVNKNRILAVFESVVGGNDIFDFCIQTCDEFGIFKNCFGITTDFAEHLMEELNLKKEVFNIGSNFSEEGEESEEISHMWKNPKIIPNEKAKKIFEFEEKLKKQKEEFDKELLKLEDLKNAN